MPEAARVDRTTFGELPDGRTVDAFTLTAPSGLALTAIAYGGIITGLRVPDTGERLGDVVLGFDSLAGYTPNPSYIGAIIGRYANRIARGRFTLDGRAYQLGTNNGPNHLHGGTRGFHQVLWRAEPFRRDQVSGIRFEYTSPDGEEGYPGRLTVEAVYTLTARDELGVEFRATSDRPTIVNLTQHTYFNLAGSGSADVLGHELQVNADRFLPVDPTGIPLGTMVPVAGTPFDFRLPTTLGARIHRDDPQLRNAGGYDHTFVLNRSGPGLERAARLSEPGTGRTVEIATTQPGLQVYSGNFLGGDVPGKAGVAYGPRSGIALETHCFPDSPNRPAFPSPVIRPGAEYRARTVFRFGRTR